MPLLYWWGVGCTALCVIGSFVSLCKEFYLEKGASFVLSVGLLIGNIYALWYLLTGVPR